MKLKAPVAELIFCASLILCAALILWPMGCSRSPDKQRICTIKRMEELVGAIESFQNANNRCPISLQEAVAFASQTDEYRVDAVDSVTDCWGHVFRYSIQGTNFILSSAGPDGQNGTDDDIVYDDRTMK